MTFNAKKENIQCSNDNVVDFDFFPEHEEDVGTNEEVGINEDVE